MVSAAIFSRQSAREFNDMAKYQLTKLKDQRTDGESRGHVVVALASAHTFSLELYLKSFIMIKYGRKSRGHNVFSLFEDLEDEDKIMFEFLWQVYAFGEWKEAEEDSPGEIGVTIYFSGHNDPYKRDPWNISMVSSLERTRDRFNEWRYLFEQGDNLNEDVPSLHFSHEFNAINSAIRMLDSAIEDEIQKHT